MPVPLPFECPPDSVSEISLKIGHNLTKLRRTKQNVPVFGPPSIIDYLLKQTKYSLRREWAWQWSVNTLLFSFVFTNHHFIEMNIVLETLWLLVLFFYYVIEAIVLFFVPSCYRRKNVHGQIALITGAGMSLSLKALSGSNRL